MAHFFPSLFVVFAVVVARGVGKDQMSDGLLGRPVCSHQSNSICCDPSFIEGQNMKLVKTHFALLFILVCRLHVWQVFLLVPATVCS